jgi:hypothetical protein
MVACPDHTAKGKGNNKGADRALLVLEIKDQVNQQNRPGEEDHRLVEIRERCLLIAHGVGFSPAQTDRAGIGDKADPADQGGEKADRFVCGGQVNNKDHHGDKVGDRSDVKQK